MSQISKQLTEFSQYSTPSALNSAREWCYININIRNVEHPCQLELAMTMRSAHICSVLQPPPPIHQPTRKSTKINNRWGAFFLPPCLRSSCLLSPRAFLDDSAVRLNACPSFQHCSNVCSTVPHFNSRFMKYQRSESLCV